MDNGSRLMCFLLISARDLSELNWVACPQDGMPNNKKDETYE
jgi:hypothetical protein